MTQTDKRIIQYDEGTFRSVFNYLSVGIVLLDNSGMIKAWNHKHEIISGLPKEAVVGKLHLWEVGELMVSITTRAKEERDGLTAELKEVVSNMRLKQHVRHVTHRKTGEQRIFDILYFPTVMSDGEILLCGIIRDITEEIKTRKRLEENERKLTAEINTRKAVESKLTKYRDKLIYKLGHLEKISRRQAVLIRAIQITQSSESLQQVMNEMLAEIGEYTRLSRVYVFEKNKEKTISCTYEWINTGFKRIIDDFQNIPFEIAQPWFDVFDAGEIINTSEIKTLHPQIVKILAEYGVKSFLVLPLKAKDVDYGYVGFDDSVTNRVWDKNEVELLLSLTQIISATTRRFRSEEAIRLSQQTMRMVLDNIDEHIFVSDFNTFKILFANKRLKNSIGKDNIEGTECWKIIQAGKHDVCELCPRRQLLDSNNRPTGILHWECHNELLGRYFAYNISAIEWIDGRLVQLETATDITDRKQVEKELIHAKEKAEESDKLKSAFLENMSHEIRTPLNAITGFLHLLTYDNLSPTRRKDYINIIFSSSTQLVKLIDDIIDVAKIEACQLELHPTLAPLNDLMHELQITYETFLQNNNKKHIMLILDDSEFITDCVTFIDYNRLRQVLNNLIENAMKFTEKGYIRFGYRQSALDELEFVVEDTGIGLEDHLHEVIFERFRQIEFSNNRLYGGTGMGLYIARSLVQMMGGDIRVVSDIGGGASFFFKIKYQTEPN